MTILQTSADIIADMLFRANEPTDGTSDFDTQALQYLNRAYRAIWMGGGEFVKGMNEAWLWLKKDPPGTLILQPIDEAGTITVTNNSTAAVLSATRATSLAGWFIKMQECPDVFRVLTHTAGTANLVFDSVYTGTGGAGKAFRLSKLEYDLAADVLRVIAPMRVQSDNQTEIEGIDLPAMDAQYPLAFLDTGTPTRFALVTDTKVRFNRSGGITSTDLRRAEYDYLAKPSDLANSANDTPLVPLQYRQVLADLGLFYLLTAKSDLRTEQVGLQAKGGLLAMSADNRSRTSQTSRQAGKILPRQDRLSRGWQRGVLRTSSGFIVG